jgi:membrane-anchored protein YejM (alkaline phosphatase superfamily)
MRRFAPWIASVALGSVLGAALAGWTWRERLRADAMGPTGPTPRPGAKPAFTGKLPNVVLVIGCTLRRDQLSPYGGLPATTPFLAELAAQGVRFTDAVSAAPWTRAAGTAIVTGQPFRGVGMAEMAGHGNDRRLAPELTTLAEVFHDAGYWTVGGTANPNFDRAYGFDQGFDRYHQLGDLWREGLVRIPGGLLVDRTLRELDRQKRPDAPVFVEVVLSDAHAPARVEPGEVAAFGEDRTPQRVLKYRAVVNRFDSAVRRLWNGLTVRGFDDSNTLFVVVGDHGEGLSWPPDQGSGHGNFLVPAVLEMPWILRGRGVAAGAVVDGLASQVDVFPTLAGLAGVEGYEGPGNDWSALVGTGGRTTRTRAFADTDYDRSDRSAIFTDDRSCEINQRFERPDVKCYDRGGHHRKPLDAEEPGLVSELEAWRRDQAVAAAAWAWTGHATVPARDRALLRSLGYVIDGAEGELERQEEQEPEGTATSPSGE